MTTTHFGFYLSLALVLNCAAGANLPAAGAEETPDIKIDLKSRIQVPAGRGLGLLPEAYRITFSGKETHEYYVPLYAYVLREELDQALEATKVRVGSAKDVTDAAL